MHKSQDEAQPKMIGNTSKSATNNINEERLSKEIFIEQMTRTVDELEPTDEQAVSDKTSTHILSHSDTHVASSISQLLLRNTGES